jgi:hypothetical protein
MNQFYSQQPTAFRRPQRISITVPWQLHQSLLQRCDSEGRSLSNLAAWLLERAQAGDNG